MLLYNSYKGKQVISANAHEKVITDQFHASMPHMRLFTHHGNYILSELHYTEIFQVQFLTI